MTLKGTFKLNTELSFPSDIADLRKVGSLRPALHLYLELIFTVKSCFTACFHHTSSGLFLYREQRLTFFSCIDFVFSASDYCCSFSPFYSFCSSM